MKARHVAYHEHKPETREGGVGEMMKRVIRKLRAKTAETKATTAKKTKSSTKKTISRVKKSTKKISAEQFLDLVEKKAYKLFEERGYSHGCDQEDWYRAEQAVQKSFKR